MAYTATLALVIAPEHVKSAMDASWTWPLEQSESGMETMIMDGRFDQQFAELFAVSLADEGKKSEAHSFWPLAVACICGLIVFASTAILA